MACFVVYEICFLLSGNGNRKGGFDLSMAASMKDVTTSTALVTFSECRHGELGFQMAA
jgi:hypothetical protein